MQQTTNRKMHEQRKTEFMRNIDGTFTCKSCSKVRTTLNSIRAHISQDCNGLAPKFFCTFCNKMYKRKYDFRLHLISSHSGFYTQTQG